MDKTYAFIINWNRLDLPKKMADYLVDCEGIIPIIVDNGSTYKPLLEYYKNCPHKVELMGSNWGQLVVSYSGLLEKYGITERFIISDPDLDLSGIPKDFLHILHLGLDRHSFAHKAGFSLEINDVPDSDIKPQILAYESNAWTKKLDEYFYSAYIDTTFCLMRKNYHDFPSIRTDRPYTAKHVPWYYTKDNLPDDERYYLEHSTGHSAYADGIRKIVGI
jgi:hypothetical protein